jgi:hypothetical protein
MELAQRRGMGPSVESDRVDSPGAAPDAASQQLRKWKSGSDVQLDWFKGAGGQWPAFEAVDANQVDRHGVFVIWRNGSTSSVSSVLYVGHGQIRLELARCQRDPVFRDSRNLHVTWASIQDLKTIDSVAAYLYQKLRPLWGEIVLVPPMAVNPPWAA